MSIRFKWITPFVILLNLFAGICKAQTQPADTFEVHIKSSLTAYYKNYPQEKIFVHTSQSVYASGQTLWYKVYASAYGKPSALSKIVYLQLTDGKGRVIAQNKLPLNNGLAHGDIGLADSLKSGWYQLRAFTAWMMNFEEAGYYHQNIYIQNTADTLHKLAAGALPQKYHVDFFPEGGDMVDGSPCNVAFRAADNLGLPVAIYGDVIDNNKQPIANLITVHDGMGVFSINAVVGNTYTATIHFPDKTIQHLLLPAVKKEGMSMQVNSASPTALQIKISYTGSPQKYRNVLMVALQDNGKLAAYPLELSQGINIFVIKKDIFATGILRLTLFDSEGIPAAERLVFIDNNDQLNLQLKADTLSSQPHKRQVFSLAVKDTDNKPLTGSFSVSVSDADAGVNNADKNILSSFLVSPELRGHIHNPAWYFKNNSDTLQQQLDLVMMTNGWRHFKWDEALGSKPVRLHYPVERSQYIAGKIINYVKPPANKPLTIKLLIMNQDSSKFIGFVTPDSAGRFILRDYNHSGLSTLFMETSDNKNHVKKSKIDLFGTIADSLRDSNAIPVNISDYEPLPVTKYLLSSALSEKEALFQSKGILLQTVVVKDKKISPTEQVIKDHVSSLYTSFSHEYTLDLVNNPTLDVGFVNYIQGRFPGLRIEEGAHGTRFYYLGDNSSGMGGDTVSMPYFYLNEAPVDFGDIINIPMEDIALIRFLPPPVVFAPYNGGNVGAILVYTKIRSDDMRNMASREQFDQYTFNGYSITREFSSPDYSIPKSNYPPDNRIMLYWNHDLNTDSSGHVKFSFYNSDKTKRYRIIIQGMDADGRLGYLDEVF